MAVALRGNPQAEAARAERTATQARNDKEKPVARPNVTAIGAQTVQGPRVTFPRPDNTAATVLPELYGRIGLEVEQLIYRPGLGAARQRYAAQNGAADAQLRQTLGGIALEVRQAYLDVLRAESGVRVAADGVAGAERYRALVTKQVEAGFAKPADADTAEAQIAEAKKGAVTAEGGLAGVRDNFNRLLGRPLDTPVVLAPLSETELPTPPDDARAAIENAYKNRPEIALLEGNRTAAQTGATLARTQVQPSLSVRGQAFLQTPTALLPQNYLAATLEVRWPLFDGGRAKLDADEAGAQAKRLNALLEATRQGIAVEVRRAWQSFRDARTNLDLTRTQVRGATSRATVSEKAYEVGRGTAIEVQEAQRALRALREEEVRAVYDVWAAEAAFRHAQGLDMPVEARR